MVQTLLETSQAQVRGIVVIAFAIYLATSLFVWLVGLPVLGLFDAASPRKAFAGTSLDSGLEFAREQAIEQQLPVTVCASRNGFQCSHAKNWSDGWIIFTDADKLPGQLNTEDEILYAYLAEERSAGLEVDAHYVRYLADGDIELD